MHSSKFNHIAHLKSKTAHALHSVKDTIGSLRLHLQKHTCKAACSPNDFQRASIYSQSQLGIVASYVLVLAISSPVSLLTHQHSPLWHCTGSYRPSGVQTGRNPPENTAMYRSASHGLSAEYTTKGLSAEYTTEVITKEPFTAEKVIQK